jgi:sugar phosphate isomerase/epimerase
VLRIGYNTNGFGCHSLEACLQVIARLGYRGVALTLDHHVLNPFSAGLQRRLAATARLLGAHRLCCVIETGARFLLDPWRKHEPTLVSPEAVARKTRLDFLRRAVDIAAALNAEALSFWSGTPAVGTPEERAWDWLATGCSKLADYAETAGIPLAFEPEPGMLVASLAHYGRLRGLVNRKILGLTLDAGHAFLTEPLSPGDCIRRVQGEILNVHIEDMRSGIHRHLQFGTGDMDFHEVFAALKEIDYSGPVNVELSRHSHDAVNAAAKALTFLTPFL